MAGILASPKSILGRAIKDIVLKDEVAPEALGDLYALALRHLEQQPEESGALEVGPGASISASSARKMRYCRAAAAKVGLQQGCQQRWLLSLSAGGGAQRPGRCAAVHCAWTSLNPNGREGQTGSAQQGPASGQDTGTKPDKVSPLFWRAFVLGLLPPGHAVRKPLACNGCPMCLSLQPVGILLGGQHAAGQAVQLARGAGHLCRGVHLEDAAEGARADGGCPRPHRSQVQGSNWRSW